MCQLHFYIFYFLYLLCYNNSVLITENHYETKKERGRGLSNIVL